MLKPDVLIRTKRKTLSLTVDKEGKLIVRAPKQLKLEEIFDFVKRKENWIRKKQKSITNILEANKKILNYEQVLFLGKLYNVVLVKGIKEVRLEDGYLCIPARVKPEKFKNAIKKWMYNMCEEVLIDRTDYLANLMGLEFTSIKFGSYKAKWGSCDSKFNLTFNFKMLMLPPKLVDYIIIHELAHMIEFNHSQAFWEIVRSLLPTYKTQRTMLKSSNFLLGLFSSNS